MHFSLGLLTQLLSPVLIGAAVSVGHWIGDRIKSPSDHDRAATLQHIAEGATALVVSLNPGGKWAELLRQVVSAIESAAGLPTQNAGAIERAAAAALLKLGKLQG